MDTPTPKKGGRWLRDKSGELTRVDDDMRPITEPAAPAEATAAAEAEASADETGETPPATPPASSGKRR